MIRSRALVDYEAFRCANVAIFIDATDAGRSYQLLLAHGEAITRLAAHFDARVLLVEERRLRPENIIEKDVADAWIMLHSAGRNRAMSARNNPQRINVDAGNGWEGPAFREIVRQIQESTRIQEEVTGHYGRYVEAEKQAELHPGTH